MPKNILDELPADLGFLAPCVRETLSVRANYRPSVAPETFPEQAYEDELNQCSTDYERILRAPLVERFYTGSAELFGERVAALRSSLLNWMEPYKMQMSAPEVRMLFTVIGNLSHPELYLNDGDDAEQNRFT